MPHIHEEDVSLCTNCKACYQDVPELFELTKVVENGAVMEVAHTIPGALEQVEVTPDPEVPHHESGSKMQRGDREMTVDTAVTQDVLFDHQMDVLKKHLAADPRSLRNVFIADGAQAMAWEFQKDELGESFIKTLWGLLLKNDDMSTLIQRFIWSLPLRFKRKFIKALDAYMSDRYPMFKGLSEGWPEDSYIPPYIRTPEERSTDFELVNQGYLGYQTLGYSLREVEMIVWLEVLRDKQCEDKPCELGQIIQRTKDEEATKIGGCPVKIHIH